MDFPREMLCLKVAVVGKYPTHLECHPLDVKLFCSRPVMLRFSFCFAVLESPSDQTASSSTHTHILFCSVRLPLCSTGIKNYYFAEREEYQWLCARLIQNLLTGGAHLKDKHPVIVNPRTAFFSWACTWNLWKKSLGAVIQMHYSGLCLVSIRNI